MEDSQGDSQVYSHRDEQVAPYAHQSKRPPCHGDDCEQPDTPKNGADQHRESVESNGLSPGTESIQQGPPMESPATETVASSSHMDSCSDCREIVPLQDSPNHTIPQEGAQNQSHFGSTEAHHIRKRQTAEPCWYCMKSLTTDSLKKLQLNLESLSLPSKGKRFSYQQDPRPHFGIPRSSRSTPFALWGCDGPLRRERRTEDTDQMSACPHCHLALPLDTLRWHEAKCLVFEGLKNPK